MKDFKISCHAISKIVAGDVGLTDKQKITFAEYEQRKSGVAGTKPLTANMEKEFGQLIYKRDNPELPQGAKTYCENWYISKKYNRKKEWFNKFVEKGLAVEHLGIQMLADMQGIEISKNEEFFTNEFIQGSPDVIHNGIVFDIKSSWDIFTFPFFEKELPNKDYYWQLQGYMALTGLERASIVYCLIDTPPPLITQELKKLYFQSGGVAEQWTPETYQDLAINYKFSDIKESERIRDYEVLRNENDIALINERVKLCREYIKTLGNE
jgi:hypothetical protein